MPAMADNDRRRDNVPKAMLEATRNAAVDELVRRHRAEFLTLLLVEARGGEPLVGVPMPRNL
jgi:hypothetical protein